MTAALLLLLACGGDDPAVDTADDGVNLGTTQHDLPHPFVLVRQRDRATMLARIDQEPYATIHARIVELADRDYAEDEDGDWDHDNNGDNGITAQSNALLGWLHDDPARTAKAIDFLERLETDFENNTEWDVNIRMPAPLIGYTAAWDLLVADGALSAEDEARYADKIATITDKFFTEYVADDATRSQLLTPAQNNHPLRTAAAVGVPGLAFRDHHPNAQTWLDWAASETAWLLGPDGRYVQADGGVSEGPFYYGFGLGAVLGFLIAMDNALPEGSALTWDCRNRIDMDPFTTAGCTDGAELTWQNPLRQPWFQRTLSWSLALRLPDGLRPPLADGYLVQQNGGALVAAMVLSDPDAPADLRADAPAWVWDWLHNDHSPADTTRSQDLSAQHLARVDPALIAAAAPPSWTDRVLADAGNAVLRTGWQADDLWVLFVAEQGAVRKTLHDHVDGLSFSLAAFGEYLLMDPGYYKPSDLDNAVTGDADAHNVILVDGQGAPDKGLLYLWGDADAYMQSGWSDGSGGSALSLAQAQQSYEGVAFTRALLLVRGEYLLVLDRLDLEEGREDTDRSFSWRLGGNAGFDAGGSFDLTPTQARWERERAGVTLDLAATRPGLQLGEPALVDGQPPHVHQFDLQRAVGHHGVVDGQVDAVAPGFAAVLAPYPVGAQVPVQAIPLDLPEGAAGFQLDTPDGVDLVLVREADAPTSFTLPDGRSLETDARALFLGPDDDAGRPLQGMMLDGSLLVLDGVDLCPADAALHRCSWTDGADPDLATSSDR